MNRLESGISCPTKPDLSSQPSTPIRRWVQRAIMIAMTLAPISAQAEEVTAKKPETNRSVGTLVIAGGGAQDRAIREAFLEALERTNTTRVTLIPTARADKDINDRYVRDHWLNQGHHKIRVVHTRSKEVANDPNFARTLKYSRAVWMPGGEQERLTVYANTSTAEEIRNILADGGLIGGTSAGAAIMSRKAIIKGKSTPQIDHGLGLTPYVIDQHFSKRKREGRLLKALEGIEGASGVGIDENTALVIRGEVGEVVGLGNVYIYFSNNKNPLILRRGQSINFSTGKVVLNKRDTFRSDASELQIAN